MGVVLNVRMRVLTTVVGEWTSKSEYGGGRRVAVDWDVCRLEVISYLEVVDVGSMFRL